jgi:hypothetical protein
MPTEAPLWSGDIKARSSAWDWRPRSGSPEVAGTHRLVAGLGMGRFVRGNQSCERQLDICRDSFNEGELSLIDIVEQCKGGYSLLVFRYGLQIDEPRSR